MNCSRVFIHSTSIQSIGPSLLRRFPIATTCTTCTRIVTNFTSFHENRCHKLPSSIGEDGRSEINTLSSSIVCEAEFFFQANWKNIDDRGAT